jgi:FtsP/CotA-like multicopper oxidase with cupredoxin domain
MSTKQAMRRTTALAAIGTALSIFGTIPAWAQTGIPTGLPRSPLFGAQPFTQKMMLFEEFGTRAVPASECADCTNLPPVSGCDRSPDGSALDDFLAQPLSPLPTREADTAKPNAWANRVGDCLGTPLASSSVEGRPPGEWFAHQRWSEFYPKVYFQTATAGARDNRGLRDSLQSHHYSVGEFGPGGLYHNANPAGANAGPDGTTAGIKVRLHPAFPVQQANSVWTFDGTFPPKLLRARYGEPVLFRHYNALPIDVAANNGFGVHTLTTHHHNGHNPAESDGFTSSFFYPGQFYDYDWPMILSGYGRINASATDLHAGSPDGAGGTVRVPGDWRETMSTHWFHDHMLDFTAQNVYKGSAAMLNIYSAVDRGREGFQCHYEDWNVNVNLCLPSGTALDWGNRDYDVNLSIADKAWDANGQLAFNIFNTDGFLGDQITVNWSWKPYFEVRARRYRFRILDASVSRYFKIAIVDAAGNRVPFHMIANDGNIMEHAVKFPNAQSQELPTIGIAERYDIVVDFVRYPPGSKLYMVNLMEHKDGKGPNAAIPLADVISGRYKGGDPGVGKFLEFRVVAYNGYDLSMNPADYEDGKLTMVPRPKISATELANARRRTFEFGRSNGTDANPWTIKTDGGTGFNMDPKRVAAAPTQGAVEIWHLQKDEGSWDHPVHIHFEEGQILKRNGLAPPEWEKWARKDVYRLGASANSSLSIDVALRFGDFAGTYMEHCHNTQHEDHSMLLRWDIRRPGETTYIPAPSPRWEGVSYEESYAQTKAPQ